MLVVLVLRADATQLEISGQGVSCGKSREALRQIDLIAVSRLQVVLHGGKCLRVTGSAKVAGNLAVHAKMIARRAGTRLQSLQYFG